MLNPNETRAHYQGREIQLYGEQNTFAGASSYKQDFQAHPIDPRQPVSTGRIFNGNPAPFEGTSSYKQDFPAHQLEARPHAPGNQYHPNPAPFDGTTTNRDTYRPHAIDPSTVGRGAAGAGRSYNPNPAPFEGTSHYRQDYPQHPLEPRQPIGGPQYQPNNAPFDGTSHYKGSSETRDQYQAWPIDPSATQRRTGPPPMRPSAPFDGSSTYKQEFRGWRLPARRPALGVQLRGDRTYVLVPANAPLPASGKQIFTTVHDNQADICVLVLRGDATVASRNDVIGQFDLTGLPPGPKGSARVEITLSVDANNVLSASATDLDAQRQEQWLRQGSMVARAHASDVQVL
ncbi:hypothetical protein GPECTOR_399g227 [Gonium pectorale]|uniref:Uncharacterized protein n=1 Tax=Gonium pectorale TaxID=33097 RepID=A0A150FVA9_GONPE|nr:hypothetical protein GPECTOR_399g227 [Gonium pectorale]|eukprot:KXZ41552.1 hypothetical protein GPECTOR_399g227 [Gonium pectorale]